MVLNIKEKLDFSVQFKRWYIKILRDFKFDQQKDIQAAELFSNILNEKSNSWNLSEVLDSFQNHIQSKEIVMIYGCGPSLEKTVLQIKRFMSEKFFNQALNLAADGASICLRENNIPIDAIFTDLDGISKSEFDIAKYMIVHAHGDNIDKIITYKKEILAFKNLIGTVQVDSSLFTINPGGFTDGDRILFFLRNLLTPHQAIYLIGMDFKNRVGKYSKPELTNSENASKVKRKKLKFAVDLLNWFQTLIKNDIIFVNSNFKSKNFKNISIEDFVKKFSVIN